MKIKVFRTSCGWWAVMVWDQMRNDFSLWWSSSKKSEDMKKVVRGLLKYKNNVMGV